MNKWVKDNFSEIYNSHFLHKIWLRREYMNMCEEILMHIDRGNLSFPDWAGDEMKFMNGALQIVIVLGNCQ